MTWMRKEGREERGVGGGGGGGMRGGGIVSLFVS